MFVRQFIAKSKGTYVFRRYLADKVVKTPYMADSITQGTLASWEKKVGDFVKQDEVIANIETDKVTIPVNCPESGVLKQLFANEGDTVEVGSDLYKIDTKSEAEAGISVKETKTAEPSKPQKQEKSAAAAPSEPARSIFEAPKIEEISKPIIEVVKPVVEVAKLAPSTPNTAMFPTAATDRSEYREKMTRMRLRIAERMKEAQNSAASLTTFNEVDMSALVGLRKQYKDDFLKKHNVKFGYMSAFVKACSRALQEIPAVNARLDSSTNEIVYPNYVDISVAVATPKGLVTPVLRSCEKMSFAEVEKSIANYGDKARQGKIALEDLSGGTFTISNGGVFGSMMGTPILNAPQVAILGMHAIKDRPVVVDGKIEIRPMMYLALTYDHRIIDGREAVTFLVRIKELLENPSRFILDL